VAPEHDPLPNTPSDELRLTRRTLFPLVGAAALAPLLLPSAASAQGTASREDEEEKDTDRDDGGRAPSRFVYVGTYTSRAPGGVVNSTSKGVYVFKMNGRNGALTLVQVVELVDPSWVATDSSATHLYATSEVSTWKGTPNSGGLTAYAIDAGTGKLSVINDQPTMGAIPAHVILDPSGHFALVANYIGANFTVVPVQSNGGVGPATDVFGVTGKGPNTARQEAPHPHQTLVDPAGRFVFGPDLGTDKVWSWTLSTAGKLVPNGNLPYDQVASGSGPRHMSFHPSGQWVYVIDEMVSSVTAFRYDQIAGTFTWIQTISTLPANFTGESSTAEIIVHPSGKWVYGSNRGHNTIVAFRIDQTTGKLKVINWTSTQGSIPRGFNIEPTGRLMLVGNQNSDTVVPFRINQNSGRLHPTGAVTSTPVPVSFAFGKVIPG
jgi:6-phosphogluconolactonase